MGALRGSLTFSRFFVVGDLADDLPGWSLKRIRANVCQPLVPEVAEEPRGPVGEVLSREALRLIADAVATLPSDFRGALTLRLDEGLSFRDIATVLGITEETARWRVFKARQKLMAVLAPDLLPAAPNEPKTS